VTNEIRLVARVPEALAGTRIDRALAQLFPEYSRARLQQWLREGHVWVDRQKARSVRDKVRGGEEVEVDAAVNIEGDWQPEPLPLVIVYEDEALLVINKAAGMVVHPAAGNRAGTLLNALLHHAPELAGVPRAGIVHRLDKDTSGLLVVARTLSAQHALAAQIQSRAFSREYQAVVTGVLTAGGEVDAPIGRHPSQRTRMAVVQRGRHAVTHYRVMERFRAHTHIGVKLETGRTHQIRVHMAHLRHPIVGDPVYGGRLRMPPACSPELQATLQSFRRQALHAWRLSIVHPVTGQSMEWCAPLPADMTRLLEALRGDMVAARIHD
jgi:23S rRNA pseudouridine1911/1915/1917 synthase